MSISDSMLLNICAKFKHILPPPSCLLCGASSRHPGWCNACDATLPLLNPLHCPLCALPTPEGEICGHCLQHPPHYSRTVAAYRYEFPLDRLIHTLKYREHFELSQQLAMRLSLSVAIRPDCIVPMPLHPARLKQRGYNQAMLLARDIGKILDVAVLPAACQRIRNTASQSGLNLQERSRNMRNAFVCQADIQGKHIAIVDDVMTTGATLNELAATLLKAGASEISAWVIARTAMHK